MNKRIEKLAEQAGMEFDDDEALEVGKQIYYVTKEDMEKFAQLIVQECAGFARQHNLSNAERSYKIHDAIKQHFSIEEPKEFEVWVCEKCGADRTKEPCQLAIEGKTVYENCPIIGVAQ